MEITGKVISILPKQVFASKRGDGVEYEKNCFVVETGGQYPKRIAFTVMGRERFEQMRILVDKSYNVSFDIESREWNGRWFTDCVAWRAVDLDASPNVVNNSATNNNSVSVVPPVVQAPTIDVAAPTSNEASKNDLPF